MKIFISILLVLSCAIHFSYGNEKEYDNFIFKRVSFAEGLTHAHVTSIVEDKTGEIWVGTKQGLNKISNNEIIIYNRKSIASSNTKASNIASNSIQNIVRDKFNDIWVHCGNRLSLYNRKQNNFKTIKHDGKPIVVYSICKVKDGLLFGGDGKLYKYAYVNKIVSLINSNFINRIAIGKMEKYDSDKVILYGKDNGLYLFNTNTFDIEFLLYKNTQLSLNGIFVDSHKNVWLYQDKNTLNCYRLIDDKLELVHVYNSKNSNLANNAITHMIERKNKIWIATDGGGIQIYDYVSKEFSKLNIVDHKMYSPLLSTVHLYSDSQDNIWIGSVRGGVIRMKRVDIYTYQLSAIHNASGLSNQTAISLFEDREKNIWIGTDGGGINRFDPAMNKFTHFSSTFNKKVVSVTQLNRGELLLSIYGDGLSLFDYKKNSLSRFNVVSKEYNDKLFGHRLVVNISMINRNELLLLGGLCNVYNITDKYLDKYKNLSSGHFPYYMVCIKTDKDHSYTYSQKGVFRLSHLTNEVETIYTSGIGIYGATMDKSGNFWLCEADGFLTKIYSQTKKSEQIAKLSTQGSVIVSDKKNRVWVGTRRGIYCYDIEAETLNFFGESDGVIPNEYINRAVLVASNNDIYLGGIEGFVKIDADISLNKQNEVDVSLHSAMLNYKTVDIERDSIPDIEIPWDFVSFKAKFTIKNADVFEKRLMVYTVDGVSQSRIESYKNELVLNTLAPGKYTIKASFLDDDDIRYLKADTMFTLTVLPPWWESDWIMPISVLLLLIVITAVYTYLFKKKQNKFKWQLKENENKLAEDKVRFLINISHELRTPLTLIYNPLKRILSSTKSDKEEGEVLKKIFLQVQNMFQLINMVLSVRKMEVGGGKLSIESTKLNEWVRACAEEFEKEFEAKEVNMSFSLDPEIGDVNLDIDKCKIVVSNLLMNALKYSRANTEICIKTEYRNDIVRVSVIDQGIGIDVKEVDNIFQRFYQADVKNKGYGIGLSYTKMLVEMHGGTINAYNNTDSGSTFYFEIPTNIELSDSVSMSTEDLMRQVVEFSKDNTTIIDGIDISTNNYSLMVVDDEPEIVDLIKSACKTRFKKILTATNGREAIAMAKLYQPDIIISDVVMPELDGFQLCKTLKTDIEISHIPIILLTTRTDPKCTAFGYKMGADNYVTKPFDMDFLFTIIKNELIVRENIKRKYQNEEEIVPEEGTFSSADELFVKKLNDFIKENYADYNLDLDMITGHMGMSKTTFQVKMKTITNMTIRNYINIIRIKNAKRLFHNSDQSISEVAYSTGYSSPTYFSTVFKSILGVAPVVYRENIKKTTSIQNISIETIDEE